MSLIGKTLLGSLIVQDTKPGWLKINGVVLGESQKFSYKLISTKDIGGLLDTLTSDQNVSCVVYNWKNGNAYIKSGFDLNDVNDYKLNSEYSTFIVKKKGVVTPVVTPVVAGVSNYVTWNGNNFILNNRIFYAVGANVYWLGCTESNEYPSKPQVIEMFEIVKKMKGNTVRSHTLGISSGKQNSLRPYNNTLNENAWDAIDFAFHTAKQYNIKLICPLTDSYTWANGGYGDFCKTRNIPKSDFWTNKDVRNDFKDFIYKWLNHKNKYDNIMIKDHPTLGFIELGNELGNIRESHGSINVPTNEWLSDISNFIKSIDKKHLILGASDECLGSKESDDFKVKNIDVHQAHFYWKDYNRLDIGVNGAKNVKKPYIVGEYSAHFGNDWFKELEKRENIKGSVFWNLYPHQNGLNGGDKIDHQDGETLWYPEDKQQLTLISNHFRRLQNIPEVQTI